MNTEMRDHTDRKLAAQVEENSRRYLELDDRIYDAEKMTALASVVAHQSFEDARHATSRYANVVPDGYLLINEAVADRIEFAIGKAHDFVHAAWEVYAGEGSAAPDEKAAQIAEINEWTATEFRRGQRSADEIVAEAAQRLKALS